MWFHWIFLEICLKESLTCFALLSKTWILLLCMIGVTVAYRTLTLRSLNALTSPKQLLKAFGRENKFISFKNLIKLKFSFALVQILKMSLENWIFYTFLINFSFVFSITDHTHTVWYITIQYSIVRCVCLNINLTQLR